jgi:alpha-2-macroglobulin-like protein
MKSPLQRILVALVLAGGLLTADGAEKASGEQLAAWFDSHPTGRVYIQLSKPMVQPGETLWLKATLFDTATLAAYGKATRFTCSLLDPRGSVVVKKTVRAKAGAAESDVRIPDGVAGGEYTLKVECLGGPTEERPVVVNAYHPPLIQKKLLVLGKAYGPGDRVEAEAEFRRGTGEPLAKHTIAAAVLVDGEIVRELYLETDAKGELLVAFDLPEKIESEDALLTLKVQEGGLTESISRTIPILLAKLNVDFFPEGGDLVVGLPSRVYFQALRPNGKPAELRGVVMNGAGTEVAQAGSYHHGMGRFTFTPAKGQTYELRITRPTGIARHYPLPVAKPNGVVMAVADDLEGGGTVCHLKLYATAAMKGVTVVAARRNRVCAIQSLDLKPGGNSVVLRPEAGQGVIRVTVLDADGIPLCERLVYRGRGHDLQVQITADKDRYMPREKVTLKVRTALASGVPAPAELALAVVDDRVLTFADDKTAEILAHLYLEKDLPGEIVEPNFYLDPEEEKSPLALELLMGTRGWRRFEWKRLETPDEWQDVRVTDQILMPLMGKMGGGIGGEMGGMMGEAEAADEVKAIAPPRARPPKVGKVLFFAMAKPQLAQVVREPKANAAMPARMPPAPVEKPKPKVRRRDWMGADMEAKEEQMGGMGGGMGGGWGIVRKFPVVRYNTTKTDVRTDFRETILWAPRIVTDAKGEATVEFWLSDAVTSFRAIAEGTAKAGLPGRGEAVVDSRTPLHIEPKLPVVLTVGDRVDLPIRLTNETDRDVIASGVCESSEGLRALLKANPLAKLTVGANAARTIYFPLAAEKPGKVTVALRAGAANLEDRMKRELLIEPAGFPFAQDTSDTLDKARSIAVTLPEVAPGSLSGTLKFYPAPLATMLDGLQSILREPCGCFEQASSSTYPNIMVLNYLEQAEIEAPEVRKRALDLIKKGYRKLAGYECKKQGYEWFGGDPGHEALTAYGLMEFLDMAKVYDGVDQEMIQRTAAWILARRDGKGGFERNSRALDSFGRAPEGVTNAYIVWALAEAEVKGIEAEIAAVTKNAYTAKNPYVQALAVLARLKQDPKSGDGLELAALLEAQRRKDGSFPGAEQSITGSSGRQLDVETTSLAILALLRARRPAAKLNESVQWLLKQRSGGGFGCTQSTVLALKAVVAYTRASRTTTADGDIIVRVNGNVVARRHFNKGEQGVILVEGLERFLAAGKNDIDLQLDSAMALPFNLDLRYHTTRPASNDDCALRLTTKLGSPECAVGESVPLAVSLRNTTDKGQAMSLARIGIPAGLAAQIWQLKELREKGLIDFYETTPREVIVYFRSLAPKAEKRFTLHLRADIPGAYRGRASCAYLYYNSQTKHWVEPLQAAIGAK